MSRKVLTPLGAVLRGALAGAAGTLAMDLVWYARYRRDGGEDRFADWEFSGSTLTWDEAAAPAQVGRRVLQGFLQHDLPESWAGPTNNVVHWTYGLLWGSLYGVVAGSTAVPRVAYGPMLGSVAWGQGYVVLPLAELYKPIWEYDAVTLAKDLSAHLVFGTTTAAVFRLLTAGRPLRSGHAGRPLRSGHAGRPLRSGDVGRAGLTARAASRRGRRTPCAWPRGRAR